MNAATPLGARGRSVMSLVDCCPTKLKIMWPHVLARACVCACVLGIAAHHATGPSLTSEDVVVCHGAVGVGARTYTLVYPRTCTRASLYSPWCDHAPSKRTDSMLTLSRGCHSSLLHAGTQPPGTHTHLPVHALTRRHDWGLVCICTVPCTACRVPRAVYRVPCTACRVPCAVCCVLCAGVRSCGVHGFAQAITTLFQAIIEPGDEVLLPDPGWVNYEMASNPRPKGNYRAPPRPQWGRSFHVSPQ